MQTKEQAIKRGRALVKKLGPGWKYDVSENLGWHYHAYFELLNGRLTVCSTYGGKPPYHANYTLNDFYGTCDSRWHDTEYFDNPCEAVVHILKKAVDVTERDVFQVRNDILALSKKK